MTHETLMDMTPLTLPFPASDALWTGHYKIPWSDPDFSERMLREHLSQEHDLASRRTPVIEAMTAWIDDTLLPRPGCRILDLGCGPGLYAHRLRDRGHSCLGIDMGPASIAHARKGALPGCGFVLGDVTTAPLHGPFDLAMMLFGEINVFPPETCRALLARIREALAPGGRILLEGHTFEAVEALGDVLAWQAAPRGGLFGDGPYLCLTRGRWYPEARTSLQLFHVLDGSGDTRTYRSTVQAWSQDDYAALLHEAGFSRVRFHEQHFGMDELLLVSAVK